jgi:hypothetical protein
VINKFKTSNLNSEAYLSQIRNSNKLSSESIHQFVLSFSNAHSWYKHFSDERNGMFFFYFLPNDNDFFIKYSWSNSLTKSWDDNYVSEHERDEAMIKNIMLEYSIPREILEYGKIKLSRYIHNSFSTMLESFFENQARKSLAELHHEEFVFLEQHLNKLNDFILGA